MDDEYLNIDLNERVRAPLWDLVFHDAVVSTWRWNFTPDRYGDPKRWDKHDLFHVLGGDMPKRVGPGRLRARVAVLVGMVRDRELLRRQALPACLRQASRTAVLRHLQGIDIAGRRRSLISGSRPWGGNPRPTEPGRAGMRSLLAS